MNESTADWRVCETPDMGNNLKKTILLAKLWVHERPRVSILYTSYDSVSGNILGRKNEHFCWVKINTFVEVLARTVY